MSASAAPRDLSARMIEPGAVRQGAYPGYTLRDLLTAVFFHRRALLIAFLVPLLLGLTTALLSKRVYVAQARLLVLLGNDYVFQPAGGTAGSGIALDRDQIVQGELEILQSTTLALETLQAAGPQLVYPHTDFSRADAMSLAADQLERDLTVTAVPESNVVALSYRGYAPGVSARVLRVLIDHYLARRADVFSRGATSAADDQRAQFASRLQAAEDALAQFSDAHGISDFDAQVSLLLQRKSANATDAAANDQQAAQVGAQAAALKARLAGVPQTVELYTDSAMAPSQTGLGTALAEMQARRSTLAAHYRDDFPLVRDADQQIAALRAQIAGSAGAVGDGGRRGINPVWQDLSGQAIILDAQLKGLQARQLQLAQAAAAVQARLDELTNLGSEYRTLKRARDALDETYRGFVHDTEQTQLSSALEASRSANIRIVQPPEPPARGSSLRLLIAMAGLVLGIVAAIATLVLLVTMRQSFVTLRDAEVALDLPVLVAITRRTRGAATRQ